MKIHRPVRGCALGIRSRKLPREGSRGESEKISEQEIPTKVKRRKERVNMSFFICWKRKGEGFMLIEK